MIPPLQATPLLTHQTIKHNVLTFNDLIRVIMIHTGSSTVFMIDLRVHRTSCLCLIMLHFATLSNVLVRTNYSTKNFQSHFITKIRRYKRLVTEDVTRWWGKLSKLNNQPPVRRFAKLHSGSSSIATVSNFKCPASQIKSLQSLTYVIDQYQG